MSIRKNIFRGATAASLLLSTVVSTSVFAADGVSNPIVRPVSRSAATQKRASANQLIVMPVKGLDKDELTQSIKDIDGKIVEKDLMGLAYLVEVPANKIDLEMAKAQKDKNFSGVQRNMSWHSDLTSNNFGLTPNDPGFSQQYYLGALDIPAAWALGATGQGVVYGSLDTGVDFNNNPDLIGRTTGLFNGIGYQSYVGRINGADEDITFGHGTFTTNCFGASTNNGFGFASPCFNSQIVPISIVGAPKYSNEDGLGTNDFAIARAIEFLILNNVKLANLSFNIDPPGTISDYYFHPLLQQLIGLYSQGGGVIFNSSGNAGTPDGIGIVIPGLVVVGSVGPTLMPSDFTVFGPAVQFAAPGENIAQTAVGGVAYIASGTSASSPLAAGVAGQVSSVNPGLSMNKVVQIMAATARHPRDSQGTLKLFYGYGVPDAAAAVRLAQTSF